MPTRLPRKLTWILAILALASCGVSAYLEIYQSALLSAHPIGVNLISGVIGFSTGILAVAVGFNRVMRNQQKLRSTATLHVILSDLRSRLLRLHKILPDGWFATGRPEIPIDGIDLANPFHSMESFERQVDIALKSIEACGQNIQGKEGNPNPVHQPDRPLASDELFELDYFVLHLERLMTREIPILMAIIEEEYEIGGSFPLQYLRDFHESLNDHVAELKFIAARKPLYDNVGAMVAAVAYWIDAVVSTALTGVDREAYNNWRSWEIRGLPPKYVKDIERLSLRRVLRTRKPDSL